jgi:hypothetical protein
MFTANDMIFCGTEMGLIRVSSTQQILGSDIYVSLGQHDKKNSCTGMDSFVKIIERKQAQQGLTFVNVKKAEVYRNIKRREDGIVQALGKTQHCRWCIRA